MDHVFMTQTIKEIPMNYFLDSASRIFESWGVATDYNNLCSTLLVTGGSLLLSWAVFILLTRYIIPLVSHVVRKTEATWDDLLFNGRLLRVVAEFVAVLLLQNTLPPALKLYPGICTMAVVALKILMVAVIVHLINRLILASYAILTERASERARSLQGIRQMLQVITILVGVIIVISILTGKNPTVVITGLGAAATVLMLVFKDSIMGMVAGVQLTLNDMLRPGDWITVPARNINGTVLEVGLTTVKVQNFDMTIVTVPPYSLVSESFQNWRGMQVSRGRRITRQFTIDVNTVSFCSPELLARFAGEPWMKQFDTNRPVVNLTLFRFYLEYYISHMPQLKESAGMIYMVREMPPTTYGVPIELYLFTALTEWKPYEHYQAALMDHVMAKVGDFGLRIYQAPSGVDILSLKTT